VPWYFYLAFKQLFPTGKPLHFFTVVSTFGVMLGVWVLIVVQSVMNGFGEELRTKIVQTSGHIVVEERGNNIIHDWRPLLERVQEHPAVLRASPYAHGLLMVQHDQRPAFPFFRSVELDPEQEVIPIEDFLVLGRLDFLDDDSIFLSSGLAGQIGARVGSVVEVYSPLMIERLRRDEILLPRELEVAGIFQTGWNEVDVNTMVGTRRLMQDLYGMGQGIHAIAILLHPGHNEDRVTRELGEMLPPAYRAISWIDRNESFLYILRLEKNVLFFLLLFIILVAAFSITSSLFITVVRKTKEIGLLGALGGRPNQVAALFCIQGFFLGVAGTILGIIAGLISLYFRNDIVLFIARLTQGEDALRRYYYFAEIPAHYSMIDFAVITGCAIAISTLAGLIPAVRASRMKPTEAFRNE
jgi:lipoprotein-releasing system permease protein